MSRLMQHEWAGNIRELQNILEKAIVMTTGNIIEKIDIPTVLPVADSPRSQDSLSSTLDEWLMEQEKQYLIQQLGSFGGKIGLTAKSCGLGIRTLTRKMRLYGLEKKDFTRKPDQDLQPGKEVTLNHRNIPSRHPRTS